MIDDEPEVLDQIDYFPFLRAFWSSDGTYEKLTVRAKSAHIRQLWALLARDQPEIMQMLNTEYNVNVMDAIHEASKHANRQPGFTYIKARPENTRTQERIKKFGTHVHEEFRRANDIDYKDFLFFCQEEPQLIIEGMQEIEDGIAQIKKPKRTRK